MAYSNNLVILLGNVGNDPEIAEFSDGNLQPLSHLQPL